MATYAIGDIHGNLAALDDLLKQLELELRDGDSIVFLGDYIDWGAESKGCIDRILQLRSTGPADVHCLMGNHEEWFLETMSDYTRHSWLLGMGGLTTIESYSVVAEDAIRSALNELGPRIVTKPVSLPYSLFFDLIPNPHLDFFDNLKTYHRDSFAVYSHGGLDPNAGPVESQRTKALLWGAGSFPREYRGSDLLIYGHWNNPVFNSSGWPEPRSTNRTVGIDMIRHGVLCAVRLPDMKIFQSARFDTSPI